MRRALSSFDVMDEGRTLGSVQERGEGGWRAFDRDRQQLGDYDRPVEAREAVMRAALRTGRARRDA